MLEILCVFLNLLGQELLLFRALSQFRPVFVPHFALLPCQAQVRDLEDQCRSHIEQFSLLSQELKRFQTAPLLPISLDRPPLLQGTTQSRGKLAMMRHCSPSPWHRSPCHCSPQHWSPALSPWHLSPGTSPRYRHRSTSPRHLCCSTALRYRPHIAVQSTFDCCMCFSYNPFNGPNENPESELPLTAGEYIYIYGDMDEDGFFEGELMDGRRGLVPSNFVERVSDDDLMTFLPPEVNDLTQSSHHERSFVGASTSSGERSDHSADEASVSPLPSRPEDQEEPVTHTAVPYPRKLTVIKQLTSGIVVGWEPPLLPVGSADIQSYNVYVDAELYQNVKSGSQTKAVIEKLDLELKAYRISVQSVTEQGSSDKLRCTFCVGQDFCIAPTLLKIRSMTATSAEVTWLPCNSNYVHAVYLNEEECDTTKPGVYWYTFHSLRPSTQYVAKVEAQPPRVLWELSQERREQKSAAIHFTTPLAGTPDAPLDVQAEPGPSAGILVISWLPVTIDAEGSSNGVRVTGYAVYADGQKVMEVASPTAGSVLVELSQLQMFQVCREVSVRTMSLYGESADSVPAQIPSALLKASRYSSLSQAVVSTSLPSRLICGEPKGSHPKRMPVTHSEAGKRQLNLLAEHSRSSDLSDILEEEEEEEEEEDLCSDMQGKKQWDPRAYCSGENGGKVTSSNVTLPVRLSGLIPFIMLTSFPLLAGTDSDNSVRIFVALFDYDPISMSPNPDAAEEELPFKEGQILKVCGNKDADGFYRGECAGRAGYIPCNMVSEVQVESEEVRKELLKQGYIPAATSVESIGIVPLSHAARFLVKYTYMALEKPNGGGTWASGPCQRVSEAWGLSALCTADVLLPPASHMHEAEPEKDKNPSLLSQPPGALVNCKISAEPGWELWAWRLPAARVPGRILPSKHWHVLQALRTPWLLQVNPRYSECHGWTAALEDLI
uniref:Peripheral-type benzodiazepine receptor-associated protein 1 n=1 Tax=Gopherus evgoodei TaxID=1825980 RepID=A0A8C4Y2W8_9SAUR